MTLLPDDTLQELIQAAITAKSYAYAPYSKFRVGAALLCDDGTVIKGCNVENASYGGTICAERTAIVKAVSEGRKKFVAIAVTSDVPVPIAPCGICRQVLREFCHLDTPVLLVPGDYPQSQAGDGDGEVGGVRVETIGGLLPLSFGPEDLERPKIPGAPKITCDNAKSYAYVPYCKFRVGAALLCADGSVIKGCNVDNASIGGTICAERTAVVKAVSEGKKDIVAVAVTSDVIQPISPCGMCRQVLREFCHLDTPVLLIQGDYPQDRGGDGDGEKDGTGSGVIMETLGGLLPLSFGPEDLERPKIPGVPDRE